MTEQEFRTGEGVVHGEPSEHYIANALRTLSPQFNGEMVSKNQFTSRVNGAIDALNKLDALKKTLFYGRDNNLVAEGQRDVQGLNERVGSGGANGTNIIHAILGLATEAGELLEALRNDYNRETADTMDAVNIREEVGDLFWYLAILAHEAGFSFEDAMRININKLRARYPDKFESAQAIERDLEAERATLEDVAAPLVDDGPHIVPSIPASGPTAVGIAAAESANAFNQVGSVRNTFVEQTTSDNGGELAKFPGARLTPLADEKIARQPVDPRKK